MVHTYDYDLLYTPAMPMVMMRIGAPDAVAAAHHVGRRSNTADRDGSRHADEAPVLR